MNHELMKIFKLDHKFFYSEILEWKYGQNSQTQYLVVIGVIFLEVLPFPLKYSSTNKKS